MKNAKRLPAAMAGLLLAGATPFAQAALNAVDPGPYIEDYGFFPSWYQDTNGRALELCLSPAVIAADVARGLLGGAGCTLLPNPGIFDPALPFVFPAAAGDCALDPPDPTRCNFPDESFWFMGDAVFTSPGGVDVTYVSALEAAFGGGDPAPNDQVSFARIRIRISLPGGFPGGGYTFIHPYGIETFDVAEGGGIKVINMTRDIGIGAPGDFTGALKGDIGPFLMDASVPADGLIPSDIPGEFFIGDPNTLRPVAGSPFGTNFVRLIDPAGNVVAESSEFAVMGKVFAGALPTPVAIERTTYTRVGGTAPFDQQDVFVKAPPTSDTVTFDDAAGNLGVGMTDNDASGGWYGQSPVAPATPLTNIAVTANNPALNNAPTTVESPLTDFVTISRAVYNAGTLTVDAVSSDRVARPALTVNGRPMTQIGTTAVKTVTLSGLTIPPARVTVTSASGGSDTEEVVLP